MKRNKLGQFTPGERPELRGDNNPSKREEVRKKMSNARKGRKLTEEWKAKIGNSVRGNKNGNYGRKFSKETRNKISEARKRRIIPKGENAYNWKGGLTSKNRLIRTSVEYKLWRTSVFERDFYTCVWCGQVGGKLNADHVKPFSLFPELRFAIDNGRTLCHECHKKTNTYGFKIKKQQ